MSKRTRAFDADSPVDDSPVGDRQHTMKQQALYASVGVLGTDGHRSIFALRADHQASDEEHDRRGQQLHSAIYQTLLDAARMLHIPTRHVVRSLLIGTGEVRTALTYCKAAFTPIEMLLAHQANGMIEVLDADRFDEIRDDLSAVLQRVHDECGLPVQPLKDYQITQQVHAALLDPRGPFMTIVPLLESVGRLAPLTDRVLASTRPHTKAKASKHGDRNAWNLAEGFLARYNAASGR